ncbi:MAG: hypothetical protein ACRDSK_32045 [Actinophytocola sp.]
MPDRSAARHRPPAAATSSLVEVDGGVAGDGRVTGPDSAGGDVTVGGFG